MLPVMKTAFGLETEYGITVVGPETVDVVHESIEIVRRYTDHGASLKWDYQLEDPHRDARGFRAKELLQDTDEAAYYEIDKRRALSFEEIKSDLVLSNGARFYNDHAHPEYSTPECSTLQEIVAHDRAGERIVDECARRRNAQLPEGHEIRLYKNNTDFEGHSYGCHDNYLMARATPWVRIVSGMLPFLVTRQIFAGAGKVGIEAEGSAAGGGVFQISQRADFFSVLVSIDTMNRRPIVNTRDEPHADPAKYRRFHVIVGDANMNPFATALKMGTTALVLELIAKNAAPSIELADPVAALKQISRDPTRQWIVELRDGRKISALDIQRLYLEAAREDPEPGEDISWILAEWENVLGDLEADPGRCLDRVDWVAKRFLLETFREEEGVEWDDPWLQALDLEYHDVSPGRGLFFELERAGQIRPFGDVHLAEAAVRQPPESTRAFFRGRAVALFGAQIEAAQWDEMILRSGGTRRVITLPEVSGTPEVDRLNAAIRSSRTVEELLARLDAVSPDVDCHPEEF